MNMYLCRQCIFTMQINSTYGVDASVLVQMSTESAMTAIMHRYKFQTPFIVLVGRLTSVAALV